MSILHIYAACPCFMNMLNEHENKLEHENEHKNEYEH
jgi:hypothetical protein